LAIGFLSPFAKTWLLKRPTGVDMPVESMMFTA
jgi:hypothetical protein